MLFTFFSITAVLTLAAVVFIISVVSDIPPLPTHLENAKSTLIYDREGNLLYTIHGEENRFEIPLSDIPKHVIDATIAIEDDRFFEHGGFDVGGIIKGFFAEYLGLGKRRGGSTITQQLVKNTILSSERTLSRKIKELVIALQMERTFSKNEILSMYLNTIPYGNNAYGIEMAARVYFGKKSKDLSLAEAAILASLPQAPSRYNPYANGKDILMGSFDREGNYLPGRKDVVLKRMEELGKISNEDRQKAFAEAAQITFKKYRDAIQYPHLVLYVKELLENKFGKESVEKGGLQVYTTIDPNLQKKAEDTIAEKLKTYPDKYGATNAAVLTVDLETGEILAMVGSGDYFNEKIDGNVNMVFRKRQPGSSFKPMVYANAFMKGYSPATAIFDVETDFGNDYTPQNYDGKFHGLISARKALANSYNIPAVKMAFLGGVDNVINLAKKMGLSDLTDAEQYGTSIGIGTGEATLYQMVTAFSVFAKGGKKIEFTPFLRIEESNGTILEEKKPPRLTDILDPQIAYSINHILSDQNARAPFWNTWLLLPDQIAAAKTGTSNKRMKKGKDADAIKPLDNWTIGYTTRIATGVWVGNNDASPLKFGADGISTAGPIWNAVMREATKTHDLREFPKPPGIEWKKVSRWSGLLPSPHTEEKDLIPELFTTFNTPSDMDQSFLKIRVDRVSKKLPTSFTPSEAITDGLLVNFQSENPTNPNWENPVQEWVKDYFQTNSENQIFLQELPVDYDDRHTAETETKKPTVKILYPKQGEAVSAGTLEVRIDINAPFGVEKVRYFFNGRLLKTSLQFPYWEKIRLSSRDIEKPQTLDAVVIDQYYYSAKDTVTFVIQNKKDTEAPFVEIVSPEDGARFAGKTLVSVLANGYDNASLEEIAFYLDDRLLGKVRESPYRFLIALPDEIAPHTIMVIAKDSSQITSRDKVEIIIEDQQQEDVKKPVFLFPQPNTVFKKGSQVVDIFAKIPSTFSKNDIETVSILARSEATKPSKAIFSIAGDDPNLQNNIAFAWDPESRGTYELIIEVATKKQEIIASDVLQIVVE